MRSAVRLLSEHPENLRAGFGDDLPLLLHRGSIDPILGVAHASAAGLRDIMDSRAARGQLYFAGRDSDFYRKVSRGRGQDIRLHDVVAPSIFLG